MGLETVGKAEKRQNEAKNGRKTTFKGIFQGVGG